MRYLNKFFFIIFYLKTNGKNIIVRKIRIIVKSLIIRSVKYLHIKPKNHCKNIKYYHLIEVYLEGKYTNSRWISIKIIIFRGTSKLAEFHSIIKITYERLLK